MNAEVSYGKRKCIICSKEFEVLYPSQIACSDKCKAERKRKREIINSRNYRARKKEELQNLKKQVELLEEELADALKENDELQALRSELEAARKDLEALEAVLEKTKLAKDIELPPMEECQRLRLKAIHLPCGTQYQCFSPTLCERLPPGMEKSRTCAQCGESFVPKAPHQKFCSEECRILKSIEKKKRYEEKNKK